MRIIPKHRRGVTPVIASLLILAITVSAGAMFWTFRTQLPSPPSTLEYQIDGNTSEPAWGDGSDCTNTNGVQDCKVLPTFDIVITGQSPSSLSLQRTQFIFMCNGTVYLQASLDQMEWVPGTPSTPGANAPQLGHCGSYTPPKAAFNRFAYFEQLSPGSPHLQNGDEIVVYAHTFSTFKDDDFHGAPEWCYTTPNACSILLTYTGPPSADVLTLPLLGISS